MAKDFKCPHCNISFTFPFSELIHLVKTKKALERECKECKKIFIMQFSEEKGMSIRIE